MANSTTYTFKADTKDIDEKLRAIKGAAERAFTNWSQAVNSVSKSEKELNAILQDQEAKLRPLRAEVTRLNQKKAEGTALTNEEAASLKKITAQIHAQERANRQIVTSKKKELAAQRQIATALKRENSNRKALVATVERENKSRGHQTSSLRKENAERRALGTSLVRHIRRLESLAVAYYAVTRAYQSTFGAGVQLNREYENMELGLSALLAAKTKAVDVNGKEVDSFMALQAAQASTRDTLMDIKKAALDTPATFSQMVGFYQQAIGHALAAGDAFGSSLDEISQNTITLTKRMSSLGSSVGMSMDLVNEEIRSLMSGDVSRDSKLALILFGNPTDANAAIKAAKQQVGGLTKLFNEALSPFQSLEGIMTFDKQLNHLVYQIQEVQREASKPVFNDLQESFRVMTEYLKENGDQISRSFTELYNNTVTTFGVMSDEAQHLATTIYNVAEALGVLDVDTINYQDSVAGMVSMLSVMDGLLNNVGVLFKDAQLEAQRFWNYFDATQTTKQKDRYSSYIDILQELNFKGVKSLEELGDSAQKAAAKVYESFATRENVSAGFGGFNITKGMDEAASLEVFRRLGDAYTDFTEKYAGNKRALSQVDQQFNRTYTRLTSEYVQQQGIRLEQIKVASDAEIKAQKEHNSQLVKLQEMLLTSRGDEYEQLLAKGQELVTAAKGNKEELLLIDQWYSLEYQKLVEADLTTYEDAEQKKRDDEAKRMDKQLKLWQQYYLEVGDIEKAWLISDDRIEAFEKGMMAGLTGEALDDYIEMLKKKWEDGTKDMGDKVMTVRDIMKTAVGQMESSFTSFFDVTSDRFLELEDLAKGVLNAIYQQILQQRVIAPLVSGLMSGVDSLLGSTQAQGGAWINGVQAFAAGGVVNSPTLFPMAAGQTGLMGEAGPEAIMPLTRIGGDLGVRATIPKVIINIENNTQGEIQQETTTTRIDMDTLIVNTVISAISRNKNNMRDVIKGAR